MFLESVNSAAVNTIGRQQIPIIRTVDNFKIKLDFFLLKKRGFKRVVLKADHGRV